MKKEFSKFFVASLKRTAMNVSPLVKRKQKLASEIAEREEELKSIQVQLESYEAPIKEATGGYGIEDLVERTIEVTEKDGKQIKSTKWILKYPETVIPVESEEVSEVSETSEAIETEVETPTDDTFVGSDFDLDKELSNNDVEII